MENYIIINSANRTSGSPGNFSVQLQETIKDLRYLKLQQAYIPYSFLIVAGQSISFEESLGGGAITVAIPPAHYDYSTFATAVKTLLDANSPNGLTYTVVFDATTLLYTISSTGNFSLIFNASTKSAKYLGFANSTTTVAAASVTSTQAANISEPYLTISISPWENNITSTDYYPRGWMVPINGNFGDLLVYTEGLVDNQLIKFSPSRNIYQMDIRLSYPDGSPVDMRGNNITLKFSYDTY